MDVIDNINALLKEKGINGAELSRMIGVSSAVYSQWNRKVTKPSNKNIAKVANALGVPVSYLTGEEQKESPPQGGELSDDELRLLTAYRAAPEKRRASILSLLED